MRLEIRRVQVLKVLLLEVCSNDGVTTFKVAKSVYLTETVSDMRFYPMRSNNYVKMGWPRVPSESASRCREFPVSPVLECLKAAPLPGGAHSTASLNGLPTARGPPRGPSTPGVYGIRCPAFPLGNPPCLNSFGFRGIHVVSTKVKGSFNYQEHVIKIFNDASVLEARRQRNHK